MRKNILVFAIFILSPIFALFAVEESDFNYDIRVPILETHTNVVDLGNLLAAEEASSLSAMLYEISDSLNFDIVVLTVDSLNGLTRQDFADDFYDYNGYGIDRNGNEYGDDRDGVLLLLKMSGGQGNRQIHISTRGFGITAFSDYGIEWILDRIIPPLLDGEYYRAFRMFAGYTEEFVLRAREKTPYDYSDMPREDFDNFACCVIGVVIGIMYAMVRLAVMNNKMRSVKSQKGAQNYQVPGSLSVSLSTERFLYKNVSRTARASSSSGGGGGSSSHSSSSGSSHGGGGRSF